MNEAGLLAEAFGRLPALVAGAVDGLSPEELLVAPKPGANPVGWLVWHLTRIQDEHVAHVMGEKQVWDDGWAARFGLEADPSNLGYGHGPDEVAAVRPESAEALVGYYNTVHARTVEYLATLTGADLDRVVDTRWNPPVTLGVRLVSVLNDDTQHVGQAAYLRGLLK